MFNSFLNKIKVNKKSSLLFVISIFVYAVLVMNGTYAYLFATHTDKNTLTGDMGEIDLDLVVERITPTQPKPLVPLLDAALGNALKGTGGISSCIDSNNNLSCEVYKITLENKSTVNIDLIGSIELLSNGGTINNLKWEEITNATTRKNNGIINGMGSSILVPYMNLEIGDKKTYYIALWWSENNKVQNLTDYGRYGGVVKFESVNGRGVTATFGTYNWNEDTPLNGSGTEDDPYKIYTIEDLTNFSMSVNNGNVYLNKYVSLENSLDFNSDMSYRNANTTEFGDVNGNGTVEGLKTELTTGKGWIPIGNDANIYSGTFLGNNNTISNIYINNNSVSLNSYGFFSYLRGAVIRDLNIRGTYNIAGSVGTNQLNVGGLVGGIRSSNNVNVFSNCNIEIDINSLNNFNLSGVGGLIGTISESSGAIVNISNIITNNNMTNGYNLGGVIGYVGTSTTANLDNVESIGMINFSGGDVTKSYDVGGIIGEVKGVANLSNAYNKKDINGIGIEGAVSRNFGGLVANISSGSSLSVEDSYNSGNISFEFMPSKSADSITEIFILGGVVGQASSRTVIKNSYNAGNITGGTRAGGVVAVNGRGANTILDRVYNIGNIHNEYGVGGGIISHTWYGELKIINSFNSGNVIANYPCGIIGGTGYDTLRIINSYNTGNISSVDSSHVAAGIVRLTGNPDENIILKNLYNIGDVNVYSSPSGIAHVSSGFSGTFTLNNAYYKNNLTRGATGQYNSYTSAMSDASMKSQSFVNTLNSNVSSINLSSISSELSGYTLSRWKLGENDYPVFEWQE